MGYEGDLYGRVLEVDFLSRLRDVVRFDGVEQLLAQMGRDVATTLAVAAESPALAGPMQDALS